MTGQFDFSLFVLDALKLISSHQRCLIVAPTSQEAEILYHSAKTLREDCYLFPDWELVPYDLGALSHEVMTQRLEALYAINFEKNCVFISSPFALSYFLQPLDRSLSSIMNLKTGQLFDRNQMIEQWYAQGYQKVLEVQEKGEFAVRGQIIDWFPFSQDLPLRLDCPENILENLREFDPVTQRTLQTLSEKISWPSQEFSFQPEEYALMVSQYRKDFTDRKSLFYQKIQQNQLPPGIAFFLPLWTQADSKLNLLEYFSSQSNVSLLIHPDAAHSHQFLMQKASEMYQQAELLFGFSPYPPEMLLIPETTYQILHAQWDPQASSYRKFTDDDRKTKRDFTVYALPHIQKKASLFYELDRTDLREYSLYDLMNERIFADGYVVLPCATPICSREHAFTILPYHMPTHLELVGHVKKSTQKKPRKDHHHFSPQWNHVEFVIHEQHGVGRYHGLKTLELHGVKQEFLELEYANQAKIYLPADRIDLLTPYHTDQEEVELHVLGQKKWDRDREKIEKMAQDHAAELLEIYARRVHYQCQPFAIPEEYAAFQEAFPFQETLDQLNAIDDVFGDLQGLKPMDRLICGDVGFGKTEVALRAAFVTAKNHRHVFLLVPTTVLADQHFETFTERLIPWGIEVELVTRQMNSSKIQHLSEKLHQKSGVVVIGTHKILNQDFPSENLGLLIVDEEHRFGVSDKEKLRKMRGHVHFLSMTGTPIPRTLSLSLQGFRDLSLIATAPAARRQIVTSVHVYDIHLVKKAIERELFRQGQVYYLCNDVSRIPEKMRALQKICPEARFDIAHGQMSYHALQKSMAKFYQHQTDVLICSTIIENGIDVSSAHTILIEDAHHFGLAQLHQLRGRVGRSAHQAYAYCLIPVPIERLTPLAASRLQAITLYQQLGSGYHIAAHDLELRGAGEVLGDQQSGHLTQYGLDYYQKMFEKARKHLKNEVEHHFEEIIDLGFPVSLSSRQIPDPALRLSLYQKMALTDSIDDVEQLREEFEDRFGQLDEISSLWIEYYRLRALCLSCEVESLKWTTQSMTVQFRTPQSRLGAHIIQWIQKGFMVAQPAGPKGLKIPILTQELKGRMNLTRQFLYSCQRFDLHPPSEFCLKKVSVKR